MKVVINKLLATDGITAHCFRDTTIGKEYECKQFKKGELLFTMQGEPVGDRAEQDSFLYVDDSGDNAELFLSDVDATFTD